MCAAGDSSNTLLVWLTEMWTQQFTLRCHSFACMMLEEQIHGVREIGMLDWLYLAYPPPTMFHNKAEKTLPLLTMRNTLARGRESPHHWKVLWVLFSKGQEWLLGMPSLRWAPWFRWDEIATAKDKGGASSIKGCRKVLVSKIFSLTKIFGGGSLPQHCQE